MLTAKLYQIRQNSVQIQATVFNLETYSFLPNSAKNCIYPDNSVISGNVQFFAESYPAISEGPQKFCKNSAKNCTIPGETPVSGTVLFFAEITSFRQLTLGFGKEPYKSRHYFYLSKAERGRPEADRMKRL